MRRNIQVASNIGQDDAVVSASSEDRELTDEELAEQETTELPERENMSLINANLAAPINAALAANVLSDHAAAGAGASQTAPIQQGMLNQPITPPVTPPASGA
jgi:hypothetical protein